jgi:type I restriction enzyme S subunit
MNKTLEEMAQALFKRWFVDFEFPDEEGKPYKSSGGKMVESEIGLIPETWRSASLGEFFPVVTGKMDANVSLPNGKYPFFSCSQGVLRTNEFSFDSSSLLLAGNGDFNVKWYEGKFEAYQRTYVLTPYNKQYLGLLFYLVKHFLNDITAGHRGSVIRFITKGMIENFKVVIPEEGRLEQMAIIFNEINRSIDFYTRETESLSQIRDFLLPRLMSGKIRVN